MTTTHPSDDKPKKKIPASTPASEHASANGDFAEEAGPKESEFSTKEDAREITGGDFDKVP